MIYEEIVMIDQIYVIAYQMAMVNPQLSSNLVFNFKNIVLCLSSLLETFCVLTTLLL